MSDLNVIDRLLNAFSVYIDSGFGLLKGDVAYLSSTLVAIDITLAGLLWALGGEDVTPRLIRKTLYVGAFAFIIGQFDELAQIIFHSFARLGLTASGSTMGEAQFLQPGRLASAGVDAARPILDQVRALSGFPEVFSNLDSLCILLLSYLVVVISFFLLSVQLFVTLLEFKLTTLAGFVLVPFALWNKTAFLAERVLGNVVSAGIKVLVLAVIVGIGSGIFRQIQGVPEPVNIDDALVVMLAALALLGLGIFGPGIATGLVAGAPQLGAGAASATALAAGGMAATAAGLATGGAAALAAGARLAPGAGRLMGNTSGLAAATCLSAQKTGSEAAMASPPNPAQQPDWARRLQRRQRLSQAVSTLGQNLRAGDSAGSASGPQLQDPSNL